MIRSEQEDMQQLKRNYERKLLKIKTTNKQLNDQKQILSLQNERDHLLKEVLFLEEIVSLKSF